MKRLLTLLFAVFAAVAYAQSPTESIVLEQSSFKSTASGDALTNVNIDPIQLDFSKRPCARIKMHINRMTREEIDMLEVMPIGGNIVVMRCETAYEGNGLIIEMTAKPNTRFYLHHPVFGDSNEVMVNLEGNSEYRMEAWLNQQYPITIATNVADAEVSIDGVYVGKTGSDYMLTVKEVLPGERLLKIVFGNVTHEEKINVHAGSVYFRRELNVKTEKFSISFAITPANATFVLNGMELPLSEGKFTASLGKGVHTYTVSADDYHTEHQSFTVTAADVKFIDLTPIEGGLNVISDPSKATVFLDGVEVGKTPYFGQHLKVGERVVTLVHNGYKTYKESVTISDGKTASVIAMLEKGTDEVKTVQQPQQQSATPTPAPTATPTAPEKKQASATPKTKSGARYEQSIEVGYSMHMAASTISHVGLNYIGGLRAGKTIFVGLGVGAEYNLHSIDNATVVSGGLDGSNGSDLVMAPSAISVPVFLHLRTYIGAKSRLFFALSAGGKLFGKNTFEYNSKSYNYHTNGIFGDAGVGLKLGKFFVSAGVSAQSIPYAESINSSNELVMPSTVAIGGKFSIGLTF